MEVATVAGLTLAVLPLIISVFEDYKTAIKPFLTLRRSQREARRFGDSLRCQQTIFENECRLLLCSVTREEDEMFSNAKHCLWQDKGLDQKLSAYLNDSLITCVSTLELIKGTLDEIQKETYTGFSELQKPKAGVLLEDSYVFGVGRLLISIQGDSRLNIRTRISHKFKLAFSIPDLEAKIDKLRRYNEDLRVLSAQLNRLAKEQTPRQHLRVSTRTTAQCRIVRSAAQKLYDTLSHKWSCVNHVEHSASICLDEEDGSQNQMTFTKVCFNMALTFSKPQECKSTESPIWLTIESTFEQPEESIDAASQPRTTVGTLTNALHNLDKKGKSVHFASQAASSVFISTLTSNSSLVLNTPLFDLCSVENMCFYIQERLQTTRTSFPIGYLQKTEPFRCYVYPPQALQPCVGRSMSLSDVLLATNTTRGMWIPDKLRLARLLSMAVLRFHSTPWLGEVWRSQDVFFFGSEELSQNSLGPPYLSARFPEASEKPTGQPISGHQANQNFRSLAPNNVLFSLGVILLELGFERPIRDLQEPEDQKDGQANEYTEYFTARRLALSRAVSRKLGPRYSRLVNRCLFCDFGLGGEYELDSTELQNEFFQEVVCKLAMCITAAVKVGL
jgi:hypothetical protein